LVLAIRCHARFTGRIQDVPGDTIGVVEETRAIFDVCAERVLSSGSRGRVPACVEAFLKEVSHSLDVSEEGAGSHNPMV